MPSFPVLSLALHQCSSSFLITVKISPFLKGKSSGSCQQTRHKHSLINGYETYTLAIEEGLGQSKKIHTITVKK
jgi:hypothetical protein